MEINECRKAFVEWCKKEGVDPTTPKGHYLHKGAYLGWCAAWEHKRESLGRWQPIETAPTDGTTVFLLFPKWDYAPKAAMRILEGGAEDGTGTVYAWSFADDSFGEQGDGWLYEDDEQPVGWIPAHRIEGGNTK
jgi:hypothetical protein